MNTWKTCLQLPSGATNQEKIHLIVTEVSEKISNKFSFGYYTREDIYQKAWEFALDGLRSSAYDETRPIEKFLYKHVSNRFINLIRNTHYRSAPPCSSCPLFNKSAKSQCELFEDREDCNKYTRWGKRNASKSQLSNPAVESYPDEIAGRSISDNEIFYNDILNFLPKRLDEGDTHIVLNFIISGIPIPENVSKRLETKLKKILKEYGNG